MVEDSVGSSNPSTLALCLLCPAAGDVVELEYDIQYVRISEDHIRRVA